MKNELNLLYHVRVLKLKDGDILLAPFAHYFPLKPPPLDPAVVFRSMSRLPEVNVYKSGLEAQRPTPTC